MIEITKNMAHYKSSVWLKFELENVFYSPSLNECLYIDYMIDDSEKIKRIMKYGSNVWWEPIESCIYSSNYEIPNYNKCDNFDNKIQELKWE